MSPSERSRAQLHFGGGRPSSIEWEREYRFDDRQLGALGGELTERESDLLDLAAAAYVADQVVARRPYRRRGPQDQWWSRDLDVTVAVRDLDFWSSPGIQQLVHELLDWLTDDYWKVTFVGGHRFPRFAQMQRQLFPADVRDDARVALFSGGLDSVLGAAQDLDASSRPLVLVSAATHDAMRKLQRLTVNELRLNSKPARSLSVPINLIGAGLAQLGLRRRETTQRTRGFVFLALGCVAAINCGVDRLSVYENGVGALNLPQGAAQMGSMATRAMHPKTLALMERLASEVADRDVHIINPAMWRTKAQMCAHAPDWARGAIARSESCDTSLTRRTSERRRHPLCGTCTSCLLRRQSLLAGGLADVDESERPRYAVDAFDLGADPARTVPLRDMLMQAWAMRRALSDPEPWSALVVSFPSLLDAAAHLPAGAPEQLLALLDAYVDEWGAVEAPVVRRYLPADQQPHA